MNKNKYLFVLLIIVILIALGVFFLISRPLENEKSSIVFARVPCFLFLRIFFRCSLLHSFRVVSRHVVTSSLCASPLFLAS